MLCVLIVEGMSVVVNVMLSLMSVISPDVRLCNWGVLALGVSLVSCIVMMSACVKWSSTPTQRLRKRPNQEGTRQPLTSKIRILQAPRLL